MSLQNNTTELQTILDTVNNLPEAGGGGVATAPVIVTIDNTEVYNQEHEVGKVAHIVLSEYTAQLMTSPLPQMMDQSEFEITGSTINSYKALPCEWYGRTSISSSPSWNDYAYIKYLKEMKVLVAAGGVRILCSTD